MRPDPTPPLAARREGSRRFLRAVAVAAALSVLMVIVLPPQGAWADALMPLLLPIFVGAAILSGNVHAPADWALLVCAFLMILPLVWLVDAGVGPLLRRVRRRTSG